MREVLQSLAAWAQIISLPVAVIGVLVSVWLYHRGKPRRALSCEVDRFITLVEVKASSDWKDEIQVLYKGQQVRDLFGTCPRLKNTGNTAIRREDVLEPITFTFAEGTQLLSEPEVLWDLPGKLTIIWKLEKTGPAPSASMEFDLLNPGDDLGVIFLCSGTKKPPKVEARIEGVRQIGTVSGEKLRGRRRFLTRLYVAVSWPLLSVSRAILYWLCVPPKPGEMALFWGAMIALTGVSCFWLFFADAADRRRNP